MIPSPYSGLTDTLHQWIRDTTGAEVAGYTSRAGGGASRLGAQVQLSYPDGRRESCYLTHDPRVEGASERLAGFTAEASALAAIYAASVANPAGMRVPRVIAYDSQLQVMLTELVEGEADFNQLIEPEERERVAFDFMRQLAALHSEDITALPLHGFPAAAPVSTYLKKRLLALAQKHAEHPEDPLLVFALRWLEDNLPVDRGPTVLVHGDAGPANFLYRHGAVTAVLDWEMTHFGDPMEDLAWIAIRDLFQPFIELPKCFAAYENAGGIKVDIERVRWYRTFALMTLTVDNFHDLHFAEGPYNGMLGNNLLYGTSHRRALIDGIAESVRVKPALTQLPACPRSDIERTFEIVLDDIKHNLVPRIDDALTAERVKALARVVKFWQSTTRYRESFNATELAELNAALTRADKHLSSARSVFVEAIRARALDDGTIVNLLHRQVQREVAIMKPVMGRLADRSFSSLE